jgi:hypothetical protein
VSVMDFSMHQIYINSIRNDQQTLIRCSARPSPAGIQLPMLRLPSPKMALNKQTCGGRSTKLPRYLEESMKTDGKFQLPMLRLPSPKMALNKTNLRR